MVSTIELLELSMDYIKENGLFSDFLTRCEVEGYKKNEVKESMSSLYEE